MPSTSEKNLEALPNPHCSSLGRIVPNTPFDVRVEAKKRKQCETNESISLGLPFTIWPDQLTTSDTELRLTPQLMLPRSCLPLFYLDLTLPQDGSTSPRLFAAQIQALEDVRIIPQQPGLPQVLIVTDFDGGLYAVERVQESLYTLSKLNSWVSLDDFGRSAAKSTIGACSSRISGILQDGPWWKLAAMQLRKIDRSGLHWSNYNRSRKSVKLSMGVPFNQEALDTAEHVRSGTADGVTIQAPQTRPEEIDLQAVFESSTVADLDETFSMVKMQYLEALYIQKTSLAYFAKGPLSRARAMAQQHSDVSFALSGLIESLQTSLLSSSNNSKRYSETLPDLIRDIPVGITPEDELWESLSPLKEKIRKAKKRKKIGKNGLHPGEESYVFRWWIHREGSAHIGPEETRDERIKKSTAEQRARETQLQIILILEILALHTQIAGNASLLDPATSRTSDSAQVDAKRMKKPQDMVALLDVLIDRLCIWQSTSQEEPKSISNHCENSAQHSGKETSSITNNDTLRDFCTEVVVPFYATRLPDMYSSICRKLGAPIAPSPQRHHLPRAPNKPTRTEPKSGSVNHRSQRAKPRKTLERVLTDDIKSSRGSAPTLTRSATDSLLPSIKRESSDLSLAAIPISRPGLQHSKRYLQREVDFTAVSQATEAKLQRKAAIEEELKGAIAALKKPNPRMAVKELVESAERRVSNVGSRSRKSKNPIRNAFAEGVQVMATPKGNRRRDAYGGLPPLANSYSMAPQEAEMAPPSSDICIPSSTIRPNTTSFFRKPSDSASANTPPRLRVLPSVEQTPSRRASKIGKSMLSNQRILEHEDDELCQATPELPTQKLGHGLNVFKRPPALGQSHSFDSRLEPHPVHDTPSRRPLARIFANGPSGKAAPGTSIHDAPLKSSPPVARGTGMVSTAETPIDPANLESEEAPRSIYEALGWDDDIDELM